MIKELTPEEETRIRQANQVRERLSDQAWSVRKASSIKVRCRGVNPDSGEWTEEDDCGRELPILLAVKCFYCGFYFCPACAEKHFGKTRAEHNKEMKAQSRYLGID